MDMQSFGAVKFQYGIDLSPAYIRRANIPDVSAVKIDGYGVMEKAYYLPQLDCTVANHHQLLYYYTKRDQITGKAPSSGMTVINVDAHSDCYGPVLTPPELKGMASVRQMLRAAWNYNQDISSASFFIPLIYDGSLSSLVWLARNKAAVGHPIQRNDVEYFRVWNERFQVGGIMFDIKLPEGFEIVGERRRFTYYIVDFESFPSFWEEFASNSGVTAKNLLLSIDLDRFVSRDFDDLKLYPNEPKLTTDHVNPRSVAGFRPCLDTIRTFPGRPKIFMCPSSPACTGPNAARKLIGTVGTMLTEVFAG